MSETKETKPSVTLPEATRQPKTVPMKWLKLGEAKDPEFDQKLFLYDPKHTDNYFAGYLDSKNVTSKSADYKFRLDGYSEAGEEVFTTSVTHYAICKPPVE